MRIDCTFHLLTAGLSVPTDGSAPVLNVTGVLAPLMAEPKTDGSQPRITLSRPLESADGFAALVGGALGMPVATGDKLATSLPAPETPPAG